ncbi:MAG: hypothetical protein AB1597_04365 [Chloroflexota bacterium]
MAEPTIGDMMKAYAEDATEMAAKQFGEALDFSEDSLKTVEKILDGISKTIPRGFAKVFKPKPSDEQIWQMSKIWGGYIGEVIRKKWGGEWTSETSAHPGAVITLRVLGADIFPPAKVYKRLTNGYEDNIWMYYQVLKADFAKVGNGKATS